MLINLTNHPSVFWCIEQLHVATQKWGSVCDFPFPIVPASIETSEVQELAIQTAERVLEMHPDAILCQGEMTLCFALVRIFQQKNIPVLAATSAREVVEIVLPDGSTQKNVMFHFVRFREYTI